MNRGALWKTVRTLILVVAFLLLHLTSWALKKSFRESHIDFKVILGSQVYKNSNGNTLNDVFWGLDANFSQNAIYLKQKWVSKLGVEKMGWEISYRDLRYLAGYSKEAIGSLGEMVGFNRNIDIALYKGRKKRIDLRVGGGVAFNNKSYFNDSRNIFISSYINPAFKTDISIAFAMSPSLEGLFHLGYYHISNGSLILPNQGLSLINTSLGFRFNLSHSIPDTEIDDECLTDYFLHAIELYGGLGRRGTYGSLDGTWKAGGGIQYLYNINDILSVKVGMDAMYNTKLYQEYIQSSKDDFGASYEHIRYGGSAGLYVNFTETEVGAFAGRYLHFNGPYQLKYYWGLSYQHFFTHQIGIQCKLYAHNSEADFIAIGPTLRFGYLKKFNNKIGNHRW